MKTPIFMDKTFKKRILSIKTPDSVDKIGLTGFRDVDGEQR